ncbi:phage tail tube protein [Streptomyces sp. CC208A]|uniref:phage tail tube protein n=1 Tax=Streptomyces sp. CC208A TaxID=3044573 RepID=UPI0024A82194|nr:phage tail tube protein [Streptomyces sp. CC208A]
MAIGSGLGAQIGIAAESTYGTYVAPTHFPEFTSQSLMLKKTTAQSTGIAAGRLMALSSRRVVTQLGVSGSLSMEVANRGMGLLLQALMGTTVTPVQQGATAAYLQTHNLADTWDKSLSIQAGIPLTTGTVTDKSFVGCKVVSAEFSCEVGGMLTATFEIDGKNVSESETLAVASYSSMSPFHFGQMGLLYGTYGAETALDGVRKVSVKIERPQDTDRYYANQSAQKAQPILNDLTKVTASIEQDYVATTIDDLHTSDAATSLVWEFIGPEIAPSYNETFRIKLPAVKVDDAPPTVDGYGVVRTSYNLTGLFDETNPVAIEYMSADTAL